MTLHRFTDPWIRSCPPPADGRLEYADELCRGLHLRITSRGRRTFSAMVRVGALAELPRFVDGEFAISTCGGRRPSSGYSKIKKQLDELAGIAPFTLHDIRRTVRSKLAELGVPREIARKVVNHEDGKVDRIYNRHEYAVEKREALERWEKNLLRIASMRQ